MLNLYRNLDAELYYSYPEFPWEQELLNSAGDLGTFGADFLKDSDIHL